MKAGDRYGFTWLNYGVIDFDYVSTNNFCENPVKSNVGNTVSLVDNRHGKRDYSIRVQFSECETEPEPECGTSFYCLSVVRILCHIRICQDCMMILPASFL